MANPIELQQCRVLGWPDFLAAFNLIGRELKFADNDPRNVCDQKLNEISSKVRMADPRL
jgi:hypothetical protein